MGKAGSETSKQLSRRASAAEMHHFLPRNSRTGPASRVFSESPAALLPGFPTTRASKVDASHVRLAISLFVVASDSNLAFH